MNALQRTLQTVAAQLKALSLTARLLIGSLMVILLMSLFLVSQYAGRSTMAPLGLGADVSAAARARAVSFLDGRSIPYESRGSDLLVPAEQKYQVLAQLTENHVIDAAQINFEKLVSDDSPFRTRDQNRQRYLVAKMNVLGNMISQMSGIERATVVLDQPEGQPGIGKSNIQPSASVTVVPRGSELTQQQVDAIAQLVSGSHAGLKPQNVAVIDARTNRAMQARTDELRDAGKYMEVKQEAEKHVRTTIETALAHIPGVRVAVNAQVDTKEVVQQNTKYDEPKIGETENSSRTTTSTNSSSGSQPGVQSNTGADIARSGKQGSQMSDERSASSSVPFVGTDTRQIRDTKGYALQINAAIGVPKSYFVRLYQDSKGDRNAQPDQAALDSLIQTEVKKIETYVKPLIDTNALEGAVAGTVAVSMIPDFGTVTFGNPGDAAVMAPGAPGVASGGGFGSEGMVKYISLGALALVSLVMMMLMVRKASVREELPTASELVGIPPALAAAESDLVGEADEASPALEGLELNDDAIRRQQMLDQITEMVSNTPEDAANLLRRWMKSEA